MPSARLHRRHGKMVKCAACTVWYHKYCVSASIDSSGSKNTFFCDKCLK